MYLSRFAPVITFAASCIGSPAFAELPLAVEGFMTEKNKTRLDISMAYANVERSSVATGEPIIIQVGPTSFIGLPTAIGERITNSDTLVATVGLRYGLTGRAETMCVAVTSVPGVVAAIAQAYATTGVAALLTPGPESAINSSKTTIRQH